MKPSVAVSEPECGRLWGKPLKAHHRLFYSVLKENGFRSTSLRVFLLIRPPKPHEKAQRSVSKPGFRNGQTQSKSTLVPFFSDAYPCPNSKLTTKPA